MFQVISIRLLQSDTALAVLLSVLLLLQELRLSISQSREEVKDQPARALLPLPCPVQLTSTNLANCPTVLHYGL